MPTKIRKHSCAETNVAFGRLLLAVTAVFIQLGLSTEAQARDPGRSQQPLAVGSPTQPTRAWTEFCTKLPAECMVDPSEPSTVDLTPSMLRKIIQVNRAVNKAILALPDRQHWDVEDRWDYPTDGVGDCEDIQLVKRKRLIDAGLPRRALRMTVVIDEAGNGHAVLMVRTAKGEFILNNKRDAVLPWQRTRYVYVMREGDENAAWVSLGRRGSPVMTATR